MIELQAYDVEVLPNFFSITFIDVKDYFNKFKDCVDDEGKPIHLTNKLSVKEIKKRLNNTKKHSFYITDTNDTLLLPLLGYINNLSPHYNEKNQIVYTHVFGFNSSNYDRLMVSAFLMFANQINNTKYLILKLYEISKKIIELQNNKELNKSDYFINTLRTNKLPYIDIDVMSIFALNKVGKGVDDNGETIYFGKSLKQTSINLKWYELLEYELPPISEKDKYLYDKTEYFGMSTYQLNQVINKWDRYIIDEWIEPTLHYNANDVFIVCELIRLYSDEINLRYRISKSYEINVLNSSRSNIADRMFEKFYSEFSGLDPSQWKGKKTERTAMAFKKVIFPFINFQTKKCQELLEEMKQIIVYSCGKKALKEVANKYTNLKYLKTNTTSGWFEITINKLTYSIATGGLHSQDIPRVLKSKIELMDVSSTGNILQSDTSIWENITDDSYIFVHADVSSFYPSIMDVYKIAPEHINLGVFIKLIHWLKETRITAKHSEENYIDGIPKEVLAQVLKIVINSIYGKLGFEYGDLCDRMAVLKVTINGQLLLLKLCETLELNGIQVYSANTDGIVVKVYKKNKDKYDEIIKNWCNETKLGLDSEEYKIYVNRDINNYFVQELNDKISYKGALNPNMYAVDVTKGYDMPIVAQAVVNYFLYDKPVLETLYECTDILDFCKTQNVGRQFYVEYIFNNEKKELQRNVRYYVSNNGGIINKINKHNPNIISNMCAGYNVSILNTLDDKRIEYRNVNYEYYANEAYKIIDPIKLNISPNKKANPNTKAKSGKALLKKYSMDYNLLFDDLDEE